MSYEEIEKKHIKLISKAKEYMSSIEDKEHDITHMNDVVNYTKILLDKIVDVDKEVCIISSYYHDVGRINGSLGHEKLSAEILKNDMIKLEYDDKFIDLCYKAIENHAWNMNPQTKEGLLIKDADKLAWLGLGRWKNCIDNNQNLDSIISLLPNLSNILNFKESKLIYNDEIVKLVKYLYEVIYKNDI